MKTNFAVAAMLVLSVGGSVVVRAQQTSNGSSTPGATPAQPPPVVVKKEPVPSPDRYPLTEAVRALESGDAAKGSADKRAPAVPALPRNAAPPPVSSEVPRSFDPKRDVALRVKRTRYF